MLQDPARHRRLGDERDHPQAATALGAGEHVEGEDLLEELGPRQAVGAAGEEGAAWRARAEQLAARVNADWRVCEAEVDEAAEGGELADCAGLVDTTSPAPPPLLTEDGSSLVLVSIFGHWVFVREVEPPRLRRICWLRSQVPLDDPNIQVEGDSMFLVDGGGEVLQLSLKPFGIARRYSLRPFTLPDRSVAERCVVPPGRYVWAQLKDLEEGGIAVVDRDGWRVARRLHRFDSFEPPEGRGPAPRSSSSAAIAVAQDRLAAEPPAGSLTQGWLDSVHR